VKFSTPSRSASSTTAAVAGAVVSKPTPRNTTARSGSARAIDSAVRAEFTTRMSAPAARRCSSEPSRPGTLNMSPYVATIRPGRPASSMAASICRWAVTQTGQPGPLISRRFGGSSERMPLRKIDTVCVPQTSMIRTRRPIRAQRAAISSRHSETRDADASDFRCRPIMVHSRLQVADSTAPRRPRT
jgi:hypothetical protein